MSRASGAGAYSHGIAWPSPRPQLLGARSGAGITLVLLRPAMLAIMAPAGCVPSRVGASRHRSAQPGNASSSARVGGSAPGRVQLRAAAPYGHPHGFADQIHVLELVTATTCADPRRQEPATEHVACAHRVDDVHGRDGAPTPGPSGSGSRRRQRHGCAGRPARRCRAAARSSPLARRPVPGSAGRRR